MKKNKRQPSHVIDNKKDSSQKDHERDKEHCNASVYMETGVEIDLVESLKQELQAERKHKATQDKKQLFWTKTTAGLVFIYAGLTLWMAITAQCNLKTVQEQFQADQRPYIGIKDFKLCDSMDHVLKWPVVGEPVLVNFTLKNVGKSGAFGVITHRHMLFESNFGKEFRIEPPNGKDMHSNYLAPGQEGHGTVISTQNTFSPNNESIEFENPLPWDGTTIYVFGRIDYLDSAERSYCIPFMLKLLHIPAEPEGGQWARITDFTRSTSAGNVKYLTSDLCQEGTTR